MANKNFEFDDVNHALQVLSGELLNADRVISRAGETLERTHVTLRIANPLWREILLPHRKANLAAQIAETAWVLAGRNDIEWLSPYLPRAKDFSDDGKTWRAGYGPRLRAWHTRDGWVDQLAHVIALLQRDPNTRRAVINLYDPAVDTFDGKDIACNNWLHFSIRDGYLDMSVVARSNDLVWGWSGINQFEWSVLQEIIAECVGVHVGIAHYNMASLHAYVRHYDKLAKMAGADYKGQPMSARFKRQAPSVMEPVEELDEMLSAFFKIEAMIRTNPTSTGTTKEVDDFPEPMFQSWLRVLQWWWSADLKWLRPETMLYEAALVSMQPPAERRTIGIDPGSDFIQYVTKLHDEKHEAYGTSWKKRGELFSILPNIARKVDRLGGAETADETSADTAIDLMVYLAKYASWLDPLLSSDDTIATNDILRGVDKRLLPEREWEENMGKHRDADTKQRIDFLRDRFERLLKKAEAHRHAYAQDRRDLVKDMLPQAYILARRLWLAEQDNPECANCRALKSTHKPGGAHQDCLFVAMPNADEDDLFS